MNEEIKEILDDLDYCKNRKCGNILLKYNECDDLLDYITNLQEENERLKKVKFKIMAIKEAISTWDLEYEEGYNEFEIPRKIKDIVWGDDKSE